MAASNGAMEKVKEAFLKKYKNKQINFD